MGKMILTNKFNVPETLVNAVLNDTHKMNGTISVTQLIDGPLIRRLKQQFDYETDVTENLQSLIGQAVHTVLERANISDVRKRAFITTAEYIVEQADKLTKQAGDNAEAKAKAAQLGNAGQYIFKLIPFFFPETNNRYIFETTLTLDCPPDHVISGTFDLYDKQTAFVEDYKNCSVRQYMFPESRKKWEEQGNIYAYMIRKKLGLPTAGIRIVAMFKDWSHWAATVKGPDYPKKQIESVYFRVWTDAEVEALIMKHLTLHRAADRGENVPCDGETRWAKANEYAVLTPTGKKAHRILLSAEAAQRYIKEQSHRLYGAYIETRIGGSLRCEKYCVMNKACPQYKEELRQKQTTQK